ncbi:MAG TPA: hypothetical protein VFQ30_07675 [Ktedonobacteraceae bacterium]|nr:hypothetical protein [Ktedonobacteraceae bacterium]
MELDVREDLIMSLLKLADRFNCTIEMATYLAMLSVGGPKKFFLWYCNLGGQVIGDERIPPECRPSLLLCPDDLELALLLVRVWFQSGSTNPEREKWAKHWKVNHSNIINAVERKRNQLLLEHFYNKSDDEYVRPLDLRLLPKVRLLLAFHFLGLDHSSTGQGDTPGLRGGFYANGKPNVNIHLDSVCYGRNLPAFLYLHAEQEQRQRAIEARQVIALDSRWLDWLRQKERDQYDLAAFIVKETRYEDDIKVRLYPEKRGDFLGQSLVSLFQPFAYIDRGNRQREEMRVERYFGPGSICGINEPPREEVLKEYQVDQRYLGKVTKIHPAPDNYAEVEFEGGLKGKLPLECIWSRCEDIRDEDSITENEEIIVYITYINRKKRQAELDARLPELNPYKKFRNGQPVRARIAEVGQRYVLVDLHPKIPLVKAHVFAKFLRDMRTHFTVNETVMVLIREVDPAEQYIEVGLSVD